MKLTILTPERKLIEGVAAEYISLRTGEGQVQILPGHAPIVATLETGPVRYKLSTQGEPVEGVVSSGFMQVSGENVEIVAETLELKEEINLGRAKAAQEKAQKVLSEGGLDAPTFRKYQLKLERSLIRQQLATKN